jgi:hypothetical protein
MRIAGAVIHLPWLQRRERLPHPVGVKQVHPHPPREVRHRRRRLGARPADQITGACKVFEEMAPSETSRSGHKDDVVHAS